MQGLLIGLSNVHESGYIHRDIKPENIMLAPKDGEVEETEKVKIVDFGLSMKQKLTNKKLHEEKIGTILYMAPEQIQLRAYTKKIDVYAAGIIIYQMLVGYHPLYIPGPHFGDSSATLRMKISAIEPELWFYPPYITDDARDLICRMCRIS